MNRILGVVSVLLLVTAGARTAQAQDVVTVVEDAFTLAVEAGASDDQLAVIDLSVFTPSTATVVAPAPVVVFAHGFGGDKAGLVDRAAALAARGYITVAYAARGFGESTGGIGLDSIDYDVKDAKAIIDAVAARPEVLLDGPGDPRIGWTGDSYGGGISLNIAGSDTRVDAIAPVITWSSLNYALTPNNLGFDLEPEAQVHGVFKQQWTTAFFGVGFGQPVIDFDANPELEGLGCGGFVLELCQIYARVLANGRSDDAAKAVLADSSIQSRYDQLRIPTLIMQGQNDTLFNLNDSVRNYRAVKANLAPVKLVWFNGGHSGPSAPGEDERNSASTSDVLSARQILWWDRYLRQDTTVDTGPEFEWYRPWVETDPETINDAYDAADSYPRFDRSSLYLSADGSLTAAADAATAGTFSLLNPPLAQPAAYSETSAFQGSVGLPPEEIDGQHAAFTSNPFTVATELVGLPRLTLPVASQLGEATLFVKLYDVAPDGSETLLRRMAAPVWAEDLSDPLEISMLGTVHRFEVGHRVKLVVATTDQAYAGRRVTDLYTVSVGGTAAILELPISTPAAVATPTPAPAPAPAEPQTAELSAGATNSLPSTGGASLLGLAAMLVVAGLALRRRGASTLS